MKKNLKNFPESPEFVTSPTKLVERYEQQTAYILSALGEIEEDFKYALISDSTTIGDFDLTPQEIDQTSELLDTPLDTHSKVVHIAQELFRQKKDIFSPRLSKGSA